METKTQKKKRNKVLTYVLMLIFSLTVTLGAYFIAIDINSRKLPNLSQNELMVQLNSQIVEMDSNELTDAIDGFQDTINQYNYPLALVSYEVNGKVLKAEVIYKNSQIILPNCSSFNCLDAETQVFKGWKVEGEKDTINADSSYTVSKSVKFVALIESKAVVTYMLDDQVHSTVYVEKGSSTTLPTIETTETHYCAGWRVNGTGELYNDTYQINKNIKFVADMRENPVVTLMANDEVLQTQQVKYDTYFTLPEMEDTDTHYFNGWKIDGAGDSYTGDYQVTENIKFIVDMPENDWIKCEKFNGVIDFPVLNLWTDGINTYYHDGCDRHYLITENTVEPVSFTGLDNNFNSKYVWNDGTNTYYSRGSDQYILNVNNWKVKTWGGELTNFYGDEIWTDKKNTYCSNSGNIYILNGNIWEMKWSDFALNPEYIWTDGINTYYSNNSSIQCELNKDGWKDIEWNIRLDGRYIWSYGGNTYYSYNSKQYVLNDGTWETKIWPGNLVIDGSEIWYDNERCYYSSTHVFNEVNGAWDVISRYGQFNVSPESVWSDGVNTYHNYNYVLINGVWERTNWNLPVFAGNIWTDRENIYYSYGTEHYILNEGIWVEKEWECEFNDFYGCNVWTDGENIYYSNYSNGIEQYILKEGRWEKKIWSGIIIDNYYISGFDAENIWTDGVNVYCSFRPSKAAYGSISTFKLVGDEWILVGRPISTRFVFNSNNIFNIEDKVYYYHYGNIEEIDSFVYENGTWKVKEWHGLPARAYAKKIWTDGENIYYTDAYNNYVFNKDKN